jgi:hypothetical protein
MKRSLTRVAIGADVSIIGKECFYECKSLCEIIFESGSKLQLIEESAASGTDLKLIQIPSSVEFLGNY